jgi:hypothetical protein
MKAETKRKQRETEEKNRLTVTTGNLLSFSNHMTYIYLSLVLKSIDLLTQGHWFGRQNLASGQDHHPLERNNDYEEAFCIFGRFESPVGFNGSR